MAKGHKDIAEVNSWPRWYPGKSLGADDLIGLENMIFERFNFPEEGYGIIHLDEDDIKATLSEGGRITIEVKDIKGITKRGHFVHIDREGQSILLPDVSTPALIDLEIEVNSLDSENGGETNDEKFSLKAKVSASESEKYVHRKDALYLGRFKCVQNEAYSQGRKIDFDLELFPPVYTLFSLDGKTGKWIEWTKSFAQEINQVLRALKNRDTRHLGHTTVVALTVAYEVAYNWYRWPVPLLVQKLNYLNWLMTNVRNNELHIDAGIITERVSVDFEHDVKSLPERLGEIIRKNSEKIKPEDELEQHNHYELRWDNVTLILQLKYKFPPSKFQIILDFTSSEHQVPDCPEQVRARLEKQDGKRIATPELRKNSTDNNGVVMYEIQVEEDLEENSKLHLFSVSHNKPEIILKNIK